MAEALEMAKKKLGLNLPPGEGEPKGKPKDPVQELEDQVAQEQDFDKRQGLLLQLRELRLQRELRVRDLEERLKRGGKMVDDSESGDEERAEREKRAIAERERLMGQAKALLDSGLAPQQVGQMLLGLPLTAAPAGVPAQGMSVSDALKLVDTIIEKRTEGELRNLIVQLDKKIDRIAAGGGAGTTASTPQSPIAYAKEQAQATKAWIDALKELGIPVGEAARGNGGESIESLREKNRHAEKMEEISVERDYKTSIATALGDVVERVGRGAAHQFMEEGGTEESGAGELDSFTCPEKGCGTRILIPPGATKLTCPKCSAEYEHRTKK
jgi:hypothetical protein